MRIVEIMGGLGNQMFQYAFFLKMKNMHNDECIKIDTTFYDKVNAHNGFELKKVFNIDADFADKKEIYECGKNNINIISNTKFAKIYYKIKRAFLFSDFLCEKSRREESHEYYDYVLKSEKKYFSGYWQNEKYFKDIENDVRNAFKFPELDKKNLELSMLIRNTQSVSVHIRRGDYLLSQNSALANVCTDLYYKNSFSYVIKTIKNPHFFVFSNDIEWCRKNLKMHNVTFVDWNNGEDSYKDMQLMSLCKHNIIANSSFSWWGAWLNEYNKKIVCVPNTWYNASYPIYVEMPQSWVRIKNY